MQLSSIKALAGTPGNTSFVLGSITQPEDGRYYLEDPTGIVPIDLTQAVTTTGFYTGVPHGASQACCSCCMQACCIVLLRLPIDLISVWRVVSSSAWLSTLALAWRPGQTLERSQAVRASLTPLHAQRAASWWRRARSAMQASSA